MYTLFNLLEKFFQILYDEIGIFGLVIVCQLIAMSTNLIMRYFKSYFIKVKYLRKTTTQLEDNILLDLKRVKDIYIMEDIKADLKPKLESYSAKYNLAAKRLNVIVQKINDIHSDIYINISEIKSIDEVLSKLLSNMIKQLESKENLNDTNYNVLVVKLKEVETAVSERLEINLKKLSDRYKTINEKIKELNTIAKEYKMQK